MVLFAKLASGIVCAVLMVWLARCSSLSRLSNRAFSWAAFAFAAASRLLIFAVIYLALRLPGQSDIESYYSWTKATLQGRTLYVDFPSCYAPLFTYLTAVPVMLWDSPKAIILLAILLELISLPIWLYVGRRLFDEQRVRLATVFYLTCPLPLWSGAVGGQNQVWVSLLLALSFLALVGKRDGLSGAMTGLSVASIKFLPLMYAPSMVLGARRPVRWVAGCVLVPLIVYGLFAAAGIDVLFPFRQLSTEISSGNLPFLITAFGPDLGAGRGSSLFKSLLNVAGPAIMAVVTLAAVIKNWGVARDPRRAVFLVTLIQMVFMLVSKKSHTSYLVMCLFPICLALASAELRLRGLLLLGVFQVVGAVEQSYWFRAMKMTDFHILWQRPLPEGISYGIIAMVLVLQIVVLSFYVWCAVLAWRLAFPQTSTAAPALGRPNV